VAKDQSIDHRIVLYLKPGCHLCEEALGVLGALRSEFQLTIEEINIEHDPGLFKKYFDQIPVLVINERITLTAPIRKEDIRAALIS
jgi:glutaredoxin-like protein DUF836